MMNIYGVTITNKRFLWQGEVYHSLKAKIVAIDQLPKQVRAAKPRLKRLIG